MKKRTSSKKLILNQETLRQLAGQDLEHVDGAKAYSDPCPVTLDCSIICSGAFPC